MARWEVWSLELTDKVPSPQDLGLVNKLLYELDYDCRPLNASGWQDTHMRSPLYSIDSIAGLLALLGYDSKFAFAYDDRQVIPLHLSTPHLTPKLKSDLSGLLLREDLGKELLDLVSVLVTLTE